MKASPQRDEQSTDEKLQGRGAVRNFSRRVQVNKRDFPASPLQHTQAPVPSVVNHRAVAGVRVLWWHVGVFLDPFDSAELAFAATAILLIQRDMPESIVANNA